jgi:citrate synthase
MGLKENTSRRIWSRIRTRIWAKAPDGQGNMATLCHGYDFYKDLLGRYSWNDLFFLLLRGELPSKKESSILNLIMTGLINPGPKDWATVAAMTASVSQTTVGNSLLAGAAALQGRYNGGLCVEKAMEMFCDAKQRVAEGETISQLLTPLEKRYPDLPGYGRDRAERDRKAIRVVELIKEGNANGEFLDLALKMEKEIADRKKIWLTLPGVAAAVFRDLGFGPEAGHGLFIVSCLPGVLAHIIEQMDMGGWHTFPFYDAPKYDFEKIKELDADQKLYGGSDG